MEDLALAPGAESGGATPAMAAIGGLGTAAGAGAGAAAGVGDGTDDDGDSTPTGSEAVEPKAQEQAAATSPERPTATAGASASDDEGQRRRRQVGCVACPAHSWVFELSTGACITNPTTQAARVYRTRVDDKGIVHVSRLPVAPRRSDAETVAVIPKAVADKIQLDMVAKALARKFPDSDSSSEAEEEEEEEERD
eukprot:COSAG06_NODE_1651_length_8804_cov_4.320620_6_plen_195_part_00